MVNGMDTQSCSNNLIVCDCRGTICDDVINVGSELDNEATRAALATVLCRDVSNTQIASNP